MAVAWRTPQHVFFWFGGLPWSCAGLDRAQHLLAICHAGSPVVVCAGNTSACQEYCGERDPLTWIIRIFRAWSEEKPLFSACEPHPEYVARTIRRAPVAGDHYGTAAAQ